MADSADGGLNRFRQKLARRFPANTPSGRILRATASAGAAVVRTVAGPFQSIADGMRLRDAWHKGKREIGGQMAAASAPRHVVMLVVSSVRFDPRVRQAARVLADAGYRITIIWPDEEADSPLPQWGAGITFAPLTVRAGRFANRYPGFLGRDLLAAALLHSPFAFHAHDLNTMLPALIAGRHTGAHVICDHHEWFSEGVRWSRTRGDYAPLLAPQRAANRWLERLAFRHASAQITVCQSIADEMQGRYGARAGAVEVIRNIAIINALVPTAYPNLRETLGITAAHTFVLYQGGIGPTRGLEPIIEALGAAPLTVLAIRGPAIERYAADYRAIAKRVGAADRLHILSPVPSADVVAACHGADVGLYTVRDICKSFRYALPNKVFEYLHGGLPVLTANYPEVRRLIVDNGVGLGFEAATTSSIAAAMNQMAIPNRRDAMRARIAPVLETFDPNTEWAKLVMLYERLAQSPITSSQS